MYYLQVRWESAPPGEATLWYHELDADRHEVRKVVQFADGHLERADATHATAYCILSADPIPPFDYLAAQPEFVPKIITAVEFEAVWSSADPADV